MEDQSDQQLLGELVNDHALMPSKLRYSGYGELRDASALLKKHWSGKLCLGKADFRSAFKTVPPSEGQTWLCWTFNV